MLYPISSTPTTIVDHASLFQMEARLKEPGTRAALVGFGEYAKHLVNLHPENVAVIYDPREWVQGVGFKGASVSNLESSPRPDVNLVIACEYNLAYEYLGRVCDKYKGVQRLIPTTIDYKSTVEVDVFSQEEIYQKLFRDVAEAPVSMMREEKIRFLMELLRYGLTKEGDVVEMGCWQGGSIWYMARLMKLVGENRALYGMDLFETHMPDPTATMCTDEVIRRLSRQYENSQIIVGLVDAPEALARIKGKLCFAHIDLGVVTKAIEFVWDRLSVGAPLVLDNYGHIGAPTWEFDAIFRDKGAFIIRLPWSEQGLVIKN